LDDGDDVTTTTTCQEVTMNQPYLHEHVTCVAAPATWLSPASGQVGGGVDGLYVRDRRVLSRLSVDVDGVAAVPIAGAPTGPGRARFVGVLRHLADAGVEPTVLCVRERHVRPDGGTETITVRNWSRAPVTADLAVRAEADLAAMGEVKQGGSGTPLAPRAGAAGLRWQAGDGMASRLTADPAPSTVDDALHWRVAVPPGGSWTLTLDIVAEPAARPTAPPATEAGGVTVAADDRRLDRLVAQGLADLSSLSVRDGPDVFYAAGSPWYLTLFGRDSLWAARLALPAGTGVAAGTLRVLARHQGSRTDPAAEEEPGKILHEVRPPDAAVWLPPVYYGTVDATALFVTTLAEAWRWGLPDTEAAALVPAMERAMAWLTGHPEFVAYRPSGRGLVNQGWKDSADGVQHADGTAAAPPLALCEVQGYAYQAAMAGADLFEAVGGGDGAPWRDWAKELAGRFRASFWVDDPAGPYPAIAVTGDGRRVDGPTSNIGHLLGTGLLDADEEARVARWLSNPALASDFGLRTLATTAAGYHPISYHAGSVWPHDTAIAALGLVRSGHPEVAARFVGGLLAAGERFDFRLPELYGGDDDPLPYPASCRPQAWAAAVGPALVTALLGLEPDAPAGYIRLRPVSPSPVGAYTVRGLRVAGGTLDVRVDAAGRATVEAAPAGVEVRT
jgi:glycogen debranching enzyme